MSSPSTPATPPVETLLVATLTGTLDPDIPPWQVVLDQSGGRRQPRSVPDHRAFRSPHRRRRALREPSRGLPHARPAAGRVRRRGQTAPAAVARRVPGRAARSAHRRARRGASRRPKSAATRRTMTGGAARPTRRLTRAITRAVAHVADGRRLNRRCAAVDHDRAADEAKPTPSPPSRSTTAADGDPSPRRSPASALVGLLARQRWFMQTGQTFMSVLPARLARWLAAKMATRWDGLLTLVPFGRRPLHFAGREIAQFWCLTVPVVAGAADPRRRRLSQPVPPVGGDCRPAGTARRKPSPRRWTMN